MSMRGEGRKRPPTHLQGEDHGHDDACLRGQHVVGHEPFQRVAHAVAHVHQRPARAARHLQAAKGGGGIHRGNGE